MTNSPIAIVLAVFLAVIVLIAIGTLAKELAGNGNPATTQSELGRG